MKTVYICGSFRFWQSMQQAKTAIDKAGVRTLISTPGGGEGIRGCLEKVDAADIVYVVNPEGYVGKSVCVDLGYAIALSKQIVALQSVQDPPIQPWIRQVMTAKALAESLKS